MERVNVITKFQNYICDIAVWIPDVFSDILYYTEEEAIDICFTDFYFYSKIKHIPQNFDLIELINSDRDIYEPLRTWILLNHFVSKIQIEKDGFYCEKVNGFKVGKLMMLNGEPCNTLSLKEKISVNLSFLNDNSKPNLLKK